MLLELRSQHFYSIYFYSQISSNRRLEFVVGPIQSYLRASFGVRRIRAKIFWIHEIVRENVNQMCVFVLPVYIATDATNAFPSQSATLHVNATYH